MPSDTPETSIGDLCDLDRYPLKDPRSLELRKIIAEGSAQIAARDLFLCPGFLSPKGLARLIAEITGLEAKAEPREFVRTPYAFAPPTDELPADHPRRRKQRYRLDFLYGRQFGAHSALRELYESPLVSAFLGAIVGRTLYRAANPEYSLLVTRIPPGGEHGWHFDSNEFVASILLREADEGGVFEYVPKLRSDDDENYGEVARVLDGDRTRVVSTPVAAGTLILFRGHRSLHHVTRATGRQTRLMALLSYDFDPDMRHDTARLRGEPATVL